MAPKPRGLCSVVGCGRPHYGHGFCHAHYRRWRLSGSTGTVTVRDQTGPRAAAGTPVAWLRWAVAQETDECLLWPFATKEWGYGILRWRGKTRKAHLVALQMAGRRIPEHPLETRHTCGKSACVNLRHLVVGTKSENEQDKVRHGTSNRGERQGQHKLTEHDVQEIRASRERAAVLARRFGVSPGAIYHIWRGTTWSHLSMEASNG